MCALTGGIEMSLPGDKDPLRLPFEAGFCGQLRVSAWRAGPYDGDPMNISYDPAENERLQKRVAAPTPMPDECTRGISEDTGTPVMFGSGRRVFWGSIHQAGSLR